VTERVDNLSCRQAGPVELGCGGLAEHVTGDPTELIGAPRRPQVPARVRRVAPGTCRVGEDRPPPFEAILRRRNIDTAKAGSVRRERCGGWIRAMSSSSSKASASRRHRAQFRA
jgi:hypothetical protein